MTDQQTINILFLTGSTQLAAGGRVLASWCERLGQYGYQPHVAFPGGGTLGERLAELNVPTVEVDLGWPKKYWPVPFWRQAGRLAAYCRDHSIRMIHAMGCNDFPLARAAGKKRNIPVMVNVRWPRERDYCQWMFGREPKPARMLCVTEAMARYERPIMAGLLPPEHVVAVHNGLDMEQFKPRPARREHCRKQWGVPETAFCVGLVGVIQRRKQTKHLVDVITLLRERGIDAWGVLLGRVDEEAYAREIRERLDELGEAVRVVIGGHVDSIAEAYSAFDLTASFARIETFGMSVAESIACGCPVVYYEMDVLDEVAGPGGKPVPMDEVQQFASACEHLARSATDLAALRQAGMDHVRGKFSAEASTRSLAGVFDDVLRASNQSES